MTRKTGTKSFGASEFRATTKVALSVCDLLLVIGFERAHCFWTDSGVIKLSNRVALGVKRFLQSWVINTLAVLVAVYVVKGIHYEKALDLIVASLLLGILNAILRPLLLLVALPLLVFTLGLFILVINALLLYFVGNILRPHFYMDSFADAFWGALIISIISLILNTLTGTGKSRIRIERHRRPPGSGSNDGGPVIDV